MTTQQIGLVSAVIAAAVTIGGAMYKVLSSGSPQQAVVQPNATNNNIGSGGQLGVGQNNGSVTVNNK
jgi:hypothetical protein